MEAKFAAWASSANRALVPHELPPVSNGSTTLNNAWHSMIGKRVVDGPIIRSNEVVSESGLFSSKGQAYSNHLNASLSPDDLASTPSSEYIETTLESPKPPNPLNVFDSGRSSNTTGFPPPHLLILDLNGSLLFRGKYRGAGATRSMMRRPYVTCLAQYLAHERTRSAVIIEQRNTKKKVHHLLPPDFDVQCLDLPDQSLQTNGGGKKKKKKKGKAHKGRHPDSKIQSLIELRAKMRAHPERFTLMCPLDAMVWSSVRAYNLLPMVDAAFGEEQSVLRACWTRAMLRLNEAAYLGKVQTTKNLETVWWSSEETYSARSTVLLDDTVKKARLQPWNLLQIPEFSCEEPEAPGNDDEEVDPERVQKNNDARSDQTLLAVIGVLEELRLQSNIPAWFRSGGLLRPAHPLPPNSDVQEATTGDDEGELWCSDPEMFAYWVKRGRGALAGRGIRADIGLLEVDQDQTFKSLREQNH